MSSGRYEVMRTNENAPQMRRAGNEKHDRWAELKKKVQIPPGYRYDWKRSSRVIWDWMILLCVLGFNPNDVIIVSRIDLRCSAYCMN